MADSAFWLHPAFWAAVSFLAVFLAAGFLLLTRPRKWWVLLAAAIAAFVLFGIFGLAGFLAALAFKLWRAKNAVLEGQPTGTKVKKGRLNPKTQK